METIRILLYTDYYKINDNPDPRLTTWGLSELKKIVAYKTSGFAEFKFDFINRHAPTQKLTKRLLSQYDELWVFGFIEEPEPPWELDLSEVDALKEWMDQGGGLLITGDHSIPITSENCAGDHKTFLNLGGALGRNIKRARELRVWEGPPTDCVSGKLEGRDNFNTQEGADPDSLDDPTLEHDNTPQTLEPFDIPHPLFWWRIKPDGSVIPVQKFPDHAHVGKVLAPQNPQPPDWPPGSPSPVVAAMGRDKRFPDEPRIYDLVVAYDGDPVNVGRIVADASFHHYFNVSLRKLPERDRSGNPVSGSSLDQIGQYYANLALWLAPKSLRDEIKLNLLFRLAEHQDVFEVRGSGPLYLGKVARHALELEFGYSNLCRLFAPSEVKDERQLVDEILGLVYLGRNSFVKLTLEEYEAVLGGIVEAYHNFFRASRVVDLSRLDRKPEPFDMLRRGFALASKSLSTLSEKLSDQYLKADEERPLDEY